MAPRPWGRTEEAGAGVAPAVASFSRPKRSRRWDGKSPAACCAEADVAAERRRQALMLGETETVPPASSLLAGKCSWEGGGPARRCFCRFSSVPGVLLVQFSWPPTPDRPRPWNTDTNEKLPGPALQACRSPSQGPAGLSPRRPAASRRDLPGLCPALLGCRAVSRQAGRALPSAFVLCSP